MNKKFLALAFFSVLTSVQVNAQTTAASNPGGFYIKGGVNFANISTAKDGSYNKANTLTTFNVGIIGDVPLADVLSVQPGLVLSGKGSKASGSFAGISNTTIFNPLYLEVPVNVVVKLPLATGTRLFFGAGPYGAVGIGGKWKGTTLVGGDAASQTSRTIKYGNDNDADLKAFDYGLNGLAGVEISRLMVGVNYGLGLAKIFPNQDDNSNDKNKYRVFSVNVGIRF